MSVAYGIDFGTTNSVLARATADGTEAIVLDDQLPGEWLGTGFDKVLPSVIGFDQAGQPIFGWRAKTLEGAKLEAVKRLFATERRPSNSTNVREIPELVFAPRRLTSEPLGTWPPRACW